MEMVIVMGLFAAIAAVTLPFTINFYNRYQVDSERQTFLALLREARTLSLDGVNGASHGVKVASSSFVLYEGSGYYSRDTSKDEIIPREQTVTIDGKTLGSTQIQIGMVWVNIARFASSNDTSFKYLSGRATSSSYTLRNGAKQTKVYVNPEGTINWQ